jgi:hypothetical protein
MHSHCVVLWLIMLYLVFMVQQYLTNENMILDTDSAINQLKKEEYSNIPTVISSSQNKLHIIQTTRKHSFSV